MSQTGKNNKAPIFIILLMLLLIVAALFMAYRMDVFGMQNMVAELAGLNPVEQQATPADTTAQTAENGQTGESEEEENDDAAETEGLVEVTDLKVNANLPGEWLNVLLVGSDERAEGERARTDTIIICSINTETGKVKLSSVLRDTAVRFEGFDTLTGTYRINAANFYGGERLLMRTLNECLGLNIEYYVHVNFYGFQQIVEALGGIDVDITATEQELINERIVEQAYWAWKNGYEDDKANIPYKYLEQYGSNVHLDGRMTLAYARLRKIDNDFARTERQRTVLSKLLSKLRQLGASQMLQLGTMTMQYIETNMTLDSILAVAIAVCNSEDGLANAETMRFPINDTFIQEQRGGEDMLYDTDWSRNAMEIYSFIYERR